MNYFELFEMPVSLTVAQDELSAKYVTLQKKYDPALFSNAAKDEQEEIQEKSSMINKDLKS